MFRTCRRCSFMLKWCWNSIKSLDFSISGREYQKKLSIWLAENANEREFLLFYPNFSLVFPIFHNFSEASKMQISIERVSRDFSPPISLQFLWCKAFFLLYFSFPLLKRVVFYSNKFQFIFFVHFNFFFDVSLRTLIAVKHFVMN